MRKEQRDITELDLRKLLLTYLSQWRLVAVWTVAAALASLLVTVGVMTPVYTAGVRIYVNNIRSDQYVEYISSSNLATAQRLVNTYINMIESNTVLEKVAGASGLDVTADQIRRMMFAAQVEDTELLDVTITHRDPVFAARLANTLAEVAPGEIEMFVEGSSAKVIDYAKVPDMPSAPSKSRNCILGALVGCMAAVLYLTSRYLLDTRIRDEDDLRALFEEPVLGRIPVAAWAESTRGRCGMQAKKKRPVHEERVEPLCAGGDADVCEAYRTLRTNVMCSMPDGAGGKVIVVASSTPGEGKSAAAVQLAISCAMAERKVLLFDCDLRRPQIANLLQMNGQVGLGEVLARPERIGQAVLPTRVDGLDALLAGDVPLNPSELLGSLRMKELIGRLRDSYDYIIMDTPPVNMVTDAAVLAAESDGVLFLVCAGRSEREAVIQAVEQLKHVKAKIMGFVLQDVARVRGRRTGHGDDGWK